MAWDRPLYLNRPLNSGSRIYATCSLSNAFSLPQGRLGGGAANAAAALINAGHAATVASAVQAGPVGETILMAAAAIGIDYKYVQHAYFGDSATLILIEPGGERVVLGLQSSSEQKRIKIPAILEAFEKAMQQARASSAFDGIFLRTGDAIQSADFETFEGVVLTHGPISRPVPSDYIVASRDDLNNRGLEAPAAVEKMAKLGGDRFKALIITEGRDGGVAYSAEKEIRYNSPTVEQVDATGAGDCFAAGFLDAITGGANLGDALTHGARWGAETASRRGSTFQPSEDIYSAYSQFLAES